MARPILALRLFGEFSLLYADAPVPGANGARVQALLAYLLLHRDAPQSRQRLAHLFWPDATEVQARNNLRQLLHQVRHVLPDAEGFLSHDAHTVRWREDAAWSLDVAAFELAIARAEAARHQHDQTTGRSALADAVGLYRADLLPGCADDWIAPLRERLRQRYLGALAALIRLLEAQGDYALAIQHAREWIQHDPLSDESHRALIGLLALANDRAGALAAYHACERLLRSELEVEPSPATRALYDRLVRSTLPPAPRSARRRTPSALPALVGRRREWERLLTTWHHASAGKPRLVLLTGEAGIGKTRLAEELLACATQQGVVVARARSYAAEGQHALAPVGELLRSAGLRAHLAHLDAVWLTEVARLLPELLAEDRHLPRPGPISEYGQRQRFFEAAARALLVGPPPRMVLIDDVQWCDQESLAWLHFLLRFDTTARLLVVATARDEELVVDHPVRTFLLQLGKAVRVVTIALQRLDAAETAHLAAQVMGRELPADTALSLYRETEGNPLFVLEAARAGIGQALDHRSDAHVAPDQRPALPPRVHAVIAGRLAQLSPPTREVAGLAAAIGRNFTWDILLRAGDGEEEHLDQALDELWTKRIVREQGTNTYDFTHDKLREVAYRELGVPQRRRFHRRIARAFEAAHADDLDPVSGQVAMHYEQAGMVEQAIPYYERAAAVARRVYANDDAITLLTRGLALLDSLAPSTGHDARELRLLLALSVVVRVTKGWTAPRAEQALTRALALCDKVGDDGQLMLVLSGLQSFYTVQARFDDVQAIAERLDALDRRSPGTTPLLLSRLMVNGIRLHRGDVAEANRGFRELTAVQDLDEMRRALEVHGINYVVHAHAWHAHALWCLGYPESALARAASAVALARNLAQPFNHALAAAYQAILMQLCADHAEARAHAEQALALASEYNALYYRDWAAILVDYAHAVEHPDEVRIARLRAAITAFTASGARLRLPYYLSLFAQVHGQAAQPAAGLAVIDEALAAAGAQDEHWWDAELHRVRGELLLMGEPTAHDAEAAFDSALRMARSQGARSLELRAATSLARLRVRQGRADEGRRLLADLCDSFTEGERTPDLQAARALLAHLT